MFVTNERQSNKPKVISTSKAALCKALLDGRTVSIKTGFNDFGITNVPREIGRSIERCFNVNVARVKKEGVTRYGQPITWVEYYLVKNINNKEGIRKMYDYVYSMLK